MSDQATERTIEALIDGEPMIQADADLHVDALRQTIDRSGLPLASRLQLHERLISRSVSLAGRVN